MDFGGTSVTGIHVSCVAALRDYYGLTAEPVKVHEPYQMLGLVEPDLRAAMGLDVAGVIPRKTMFGFPADDWKEWNFHGLDVLVPGDFRIRTEPNGDILIYPEGDETAAPSGRMPVGSAFFDTIIRQPAIDDETLDPADNLEEFGPISEEDLDHIERSVRAAGANGCGVAATFGGTAFGDIALVPAPFLKKPERHTRRRGVVHVDADAARLHPPDLRAPVRNRHREPGADPRAHRRRGGLHVRLRHRFRHADFGVLFRVATFRELWFPYYKRVNDWVHANTTWKCFKHSCGSVERFFESFIEAGFDIINPVQCSAAGMDPAELKRKYGSRLVFWGGGVDTQKTLPFGTPQEVREEVLRRCEIFAPGGGFVFNSIHNLQAGTPVENIVAMLDAVHEFNGVSHV